MVSESSDNVWGLGFKVQGFCLGSLGFRVVCLGFSVQGLGFPVCCLGSGFET